MSFATGARPRWTTWSTIWGIGEQKRRSFGAELLALIASYTD